MCLLSTGSRVRAPPGSPEFSASYEDFAFVSRTQKGLNTNQARLLIETTFFSGLQSS